MESNLCNFEREIHIFLALLTNLFSLTDIHQVLGLEYYLQFTGPRKQTTFTFKKKSNKIPVCHLTNLRCETGIHQDGESK